MTDGRADVSFERWQRQRDQEAMKRAADACAAAGTRPGSRRGYLTAEEAAARQQEQNQGNGSLEIASGGRTESHAAVPARQPPADPQVALRSVRLSLAAVVVLVMFLLWIRQLRGRR